MNQIRFVFGLLLCLAVTGSYHAQVYGCTSSFAPNFNPEATVEDYTCDYDLPQLLSEGYCIQELLDGNVWWYDLRGLEYGGGFIAHIDGSENRAMIAYGSAIGSYQWGCNGANISTSSDPYMGEENTLSIITYGCSGSNASPAASEAYNFEGNGYDDWILPSKLDYGNCFGLCGTSSVSTWDASWSSSQYSAEKAWTMTTTTSSGYQEEKDAYIDVFPVRYIDLNSCGCMDDSACNYSEEVDIDTGACDYEDALGECGGSCISDIDEDSICDDQDDCVGEFDECGTCNGLGAIYECGCDDIPEGECDCQGTLLDECGVCNGDNSTCLDECGVPNGDNSTCLDECGVTNGPGSIYECGCADIPEGECDCEGTVPESGYDCLGNCLNDADGDGVCDEFEVLGCTDLAACNFEEEATEDNSSCILPGDFCNDADYLTVDDFIQADCSCNGFGCSNPSACNYSATALHQPELCDFESCQGCLDNTACNFSSTSTVDDGSCFYVGDDCDDGDVASFNDSVQSDCDCEGQFIGGCTYGVACNYTPDAIIDDGSCIFIGDPCDDLNPLTFDDYVDDYCFCGGIEITTVNELEALQVKIYPNPVSNNLTIDLGDLSGMETSIKIFDSSSRLVFEKLSSATLLIDVSGFAKGMYSIDLTTGEQVFRSQIVID